MKETSIGGPQRAFGSTLWTVVLEAQDPGSPGRREALQRLIEAYWKPVYFFVRRKGSDPESAKDLTQGFFAALLERNFLKNVHRDRGRFRTFLLTALENYLADERDRARALKRGGDRAVFPLDFEGAENEVPGEPASPESPDRAFRRDWAMRVLSRALQDVRAEFAASGREGEFEALRLHLSLGAGPAPSYADLARRLGVSEQDVANRIHRARARVREAVLGVIRSYSGTEEDAQEELRDLLSAFQ